MKKLARVMKTIDMDVRKIDMVCIKEDEKITLYVYFDEKHLFYEKYEEDDPIPMGFETDARLLREFCEMCPPGRQMQLSTPEQFSNEVFVTYSP